MKRFYKDAGIRAAADGFQVLLDGKSVLTPARNGLAVPTESLARAIAAEWQAQGEEIAPVSMPFLRLADTVIDGIAASPAPVAAAILRFGENDLLCYRAENPPGLAALQRENWDPLIAWAESLYGVRFVLADGLNHVDQPPATLAALAARLARFDAWRLAGLHVAASITGSLLLALALAEGLRDPAQVFSLSRIDEDYQAGKWGEDAEAAARAAALARELDHAARFLALLDA